MPSTVLFASWGLLDPILKTSCGLISSGATSVPNFPSKGLANRIGHKYVLANKHYTNIIIAKIITRKGA